jgi:hypothetical protein
MSPVLPAPPERPRRRLGVPRLSSDPDKRSVQVGLLATILIHVVILLLLPKALRNDFRGAFQPRRDPTPFNIELAPEAFQAPKPPNPLKFVETNPDAPENKPDKTTNFGAQDQQLAQEKPAEKPGDRPSTTGRDDVKSSQIVTGNHNKPVEMSEPTPPPEDAVPAQAAAPKLEQNPLPGTEKKEGDDPDAFGTNRAKVAESPRAVPEKVEGVKNVPLIQGADATTPMIDPKKPQPRRSIADIRSHSRPAIFENNPAGTANIGVIAHNALRTTYGTYLQRIIDAVDQRWDDKLTESRIRPPVNTKVTVTFELNSEGRVSKIVKVEGTAGDFGEKACVYAINPRDDFSYGKWPADMVSILGETTEITFEFFYE